MPRRRLLRSRRFAAPGLASLLVVLAIASPAAAVDPDPCADAEVEYEVAANLMLRDTPMGAADGVYPQGTGTLKLRIRRDASGGASDVRLVSLDLVDHIVIATRTLAWTTTITTDATTTVTRDAAAGSLRKGAIEWATAVSGYRTDGTVHCEGTMCGAFGAPPRGDSPLHDGPYNLRFKPFVLSGDGGTFTMEYAFVSRSSLQSAYVALAGRQVRKTCVGR